ncbi:restriction endonuclease subunit S [Staphylococcus simiae]|uniref:restriction endonuclease subunit S n=1 Tax=Staphylococcus simiae TaxID=308354 RepID=UPI001A95A614|nr:restriction endonuclease subunit S [Staphylococcus simiae]MBO1198386.1 restriction endonuclease subunit S [Staphylococcus simiae]MBO1200580.1 restriction endonuclease subunit S [Staphylococcus simiae]MBO1202851.1 restriction endonuclease subunit S [Staphylococcus simiae]MBO1210378.1 restriction endonuclease subunit S [Staphylococcus simiae]MBO1228917.1 restriction endonuclease subunit S [Staphylococcus simiae]
MSNENRKVPELRFPEFTGEWEEKKLGEYLIECTKCGTQFETGFPVATSSRHGLYKQEDYFDGKRTFSKDNVQYSIVPVGYITYRHMSDDNIFKFNMNSFDGSVLVSKEYPVFTGNDLADNRFIINELNNNSRFTKFCIMQKKGGTRTRLYYKVLKNYSSFFPNKLEQKKIGNFFSILDRQIELEEQKLELLKQQKKGYMQKIFSQELRFKDENGNDYSAWKEKKLNELYDKGKAGGTPKSTESKYYNGDISFLSISDITEQGKFLRQTEKSITQAGLENSTAWVVPKNSINYAMYASVGYLSINKIEVATSQAIFNMVFNNYSLVEYLYYYLNYIRDTGILEKLVGTGTQSNLSASTMKNMNVNLPEFNEMVKICNFFSKLDDFIEKQSAKIKLLKERKKGLLQKMFT